MSFIDKRKLKLNVTSSNTSIANFRSLNDEDSYINIIASKTSNITNVYNSAFLQIAQVRHMRHISGYKIRIQS